MAQSRGCPWPVFRGDEMQLVHYEVHDELLEQNEGEAVTIGQVFQEQSAPWKIVMLAFPAASMALYLLIATMLLG